MKRVVYFFLLLIVAGLILGYWVFFAPNIFSEKRAGVKIPTGSTYEDVLRILKKDKVIESEFAFKIVSWQKHYSSQNVKPGYYQFYRGMNNRQIVNILRSGLQTPVTLVIYNIRTKDEFAGLIGRTLELDSNEVLAKLNDSNFCGQYGLDTSNILTHFIVDNYEFFWTIPMDKFFDRMDKAYTAFWNDTRKNEAVSIHLTPGKVITLASIVEKEVIRDTELVTVAGVYLNRLNCGMPLQADPTLIFATRDFNARRVTDYHKQVESPYNTYKHAGLPPGPVCMPRKKSIDAVLNATKHGFLYFCANPDLSGYSIFSKSFADQMNAAARYRKKLNELNVH